MLYKLQIAELRQEPIYQTLKQQVQEIAGLLSEKESIPMVAAELSLIQDLQTNEWWQDATTLMIEEVRRKLRGLVGLIEKKARKPIYTNFEDTIGTGELVDSVQLLASDEFDQFRLRTRNLLNQYQENLTIQRLKRNQALTQTDLEELEKFLIEQGAGTQAMINKAKEEDKGLGVFIRHLVGLDRSAAREVFSDFLSEGTYTSNQIQFVNEIINYLTQHGVMEVGRLYEQPFSEIASSPDDLFKESDLDKICSLIDFVRKRAEDPIAA